MLNVSIMKKIITLLFLICLISNNYFAQNVAINGTGAAPVASAMLDIASTTSGLLIPRMISAQRTAIATPATGLTVYDTTTGSFWYYNGTIWVEMSTSNNGWLLAGNTLTVNGILGSLNAFDVRFFSNNTERMRILSAGQVAVNSTATFANSTLYSLATGNNDAVDGNANGSGAAVYGQNIGTGQGVYGLSTNATGFGVLGLNTNAGGTAVYGVNNAAAGAGVAFGGYFRNNQTGGAGIASALGLNSYFAGTAVSAIAVNTLASGRGVLGACDNVTGAGVQGQSAGLGSCFGVLGVTSGATISPIGVYGVNSGVIDGNSFLTSGCRKAIYGQENNLAAQYAFGVYGSGGNQIRSGGVIGHNNGTALFSAGALGYYTSGFVNTAVYGFGTAYTNGVVGGKVSNGSSSLNSLNDANAMVGLGIYGGVMGGWIKGLIYGVNLSGVRYGAYVHGKTITNDVIAVLNTNENTNDRTATYASTAMKVEVTDKGISKLEQGKKVVLFNSKFASLLSKNEPVIITVSPLGNSQGLYIENITNDGFTVIENNGGNSTVNFNWIAIGVKKGFENPNISPEILDSDFEEKINGNSGVMYNENNPELPTYSIWWDGTKVRFDKPNIDIKKEESAIKPAEAKEIKNVTLDENLKTKKETAKNH